MKQKYILFKGRYFINEFVNIISNWEKLDDNKKLPPRDLIINLKENYNKEQERTNKKYDEFIELYKVKPREFDLNYLKSRANLS